MCVDNTSLEEGEETWGFVPEEDDIFPTLWGPLVAPSSSFYRLEDELNEIQEMEEETNESNRQFARRMTGCVLTDIYASILQLLGDVRPKLRTRF